MNAHKVFYLFSLFSILFFLKSYGVNSNECPPPGPPPVGKVWDPEVCDFVPIPVPGGGGGGGGSGGCTQPLNCLNVDVTDPSVSWDPDNCCYRIGKKEIQTMSQSIPPPQDVTGSRYRKIALNGLPISDEKPHQTGESDIAHEVTYIDALTASLVHSTTDVYIPIPNSDLALSVRRNAVEEIFSNESVTVPEAIAGSYSQGQSLQNNRPFGSAWSSNISPVLRMEERVTTSCSSYNFSSYIYVEDESGVTHRFIPSASTFPSLQVNSGTGNFLPSSAGQFDGLSGVGISASFKPLPHNSFQLDPLQNTLEFSGTEFILTKKFGTKLTYEYISSATVQSSRDYYNCDSLCEENPEGGRALCSSTNPPSNCCSICQPAPSFGDELPCGRPEGLQEDARYIVSSTQERFQFARLISVEDRFGNKLVYDYVDADSFIPQFVRAFTNNTEIANIEIEYSSVGGNPPLVDKIKIPPLVSGQPKAVIDYSYAGRRLQSVTKPAVAVPGAGTHRPVTQYDYWVDTEVDSRPEELMGCSFTGAKKLVNYTHIALDEIIDPNLKEYSFIYQFDGTRNQYSSLQTSADCGSYSFLFPLNGQSSRIVRVDLPEGLSTTLSSGGDVSTFYGFSTANVGTPQLVGSSFRETTVVDAQGISRTYRWEGSTIFPVATTEVEVDLSETFSREMPPMFLFFDNLTITSPLGEESITFSLEANMAPETITDFSSNQTTFEYDDDSSNPLYRMTFSDSTTTSGDDAIVKIPDPTSQTRDGVGTRHFKYATHLHLMERMVDEEGRLTVFSFDYDDPNLADLGRRISRKVYPGPVDPLVSWDPPVGQSPIQETTWEYDAVYSNFVVKRTVKSIGQGEGVGELDWVVDLVMLYEPDSNGNLAREAIDMNGNGVIDAGVDLITSYTYDPRFNKISSTDPRGHTTYFVYDDLNRIEKIVYPPATGPEDSNASTSLIFYDARGNKVKGTDENGHSTLYDYDGLNRLIRTARDMDGSDTINTGDLITETTYNNVGSRISTRDPNGGTTRYVYDDIQRLKQVQILGVDNPSIPEDIITQFEYDVTKNPGASLFDSSGFKPTKTIDPRGYVTEVTYDSAYRPIETKAEYEANTFAVTTSQYDNVGNLLSVTDPLLRVTTTEYDALNRPTKVIYPDLTEVESFYTSTGLSYRVEDALGRVTSTEYDPASRPIKLIQPEVDDGTGVTSHPVTQTVYDANGNVIQTIDPLQRTSTYVFDERNRPIEEKHPAVEYMDEAGVWVTTPANPTITTTYDPVGNILSVTDPRGFVTYSRYDVANRPTHVVSPKVTVEGEGTVYSVTSSVYDYNGNVLEQKQEKIEGSGDPVSDTPTFIRTNAINTYDALNRLLTTTDPEGIVVSNEYDKVGNNTAVIAYRDRNDLANTTQRTEFEYDGFNRNTIIRHPDNSIKTVAHNAVHIISRTDELGQVTTYEYDLRDRLLKVDYGNDTVIDREFDYDLVGNLQSVDEAGTAADVTYTYDSLNRMVSETSSGVEHHYTHDLVGNLIKTEYGDGLGGTRLTLLSTFDALNRAETLSENGRTTTYRYDLAGNMREHEQPSGGTIKKDYDALGRIYAEYGPEDTASVPLYVYVYTFDVFGNLAKQDESYPSTYSHLDNRVITMSYDGNNRLLTENITLASGIVATTYGYDDASNRTSKSVTDHGVLVENQVNTYNNLNQITQFADSVSNPSRAVSFSYDLNGNRISRTEGLSLTDYGYDYENRLLSVSTDEDGDTLVDQAHTYAYDYRTRRVVRNESGASGSNTKVVFSGGLSVQEYENGSTSPEVEYVRGSGYGGGIGGLLYTLRAGTDSYNHYNSRGDVVAKTDSSGSLIYQASYEAFGRHGDTASSQEWGVNPDRQQANTKDEDPTGLLNEGFRYRDLETGTFITRDPLGFVDGPNCYTYVRQNPWSAYDPTGLFGDFFGQGMEMLEHLRHGAEDIFEDLGQLGEELAEGAEEVFDQGVEAVGQGVDMLQDQAGKLVDELEETAMEVVTASQSVAQQVTQTANRAFQQASSAVSSGLSTAQSYAGFGSNANLFGSGLSLGEASGAFLGGASNGAQAYFDGLIPFIDPFADNGFYDTNDPFLAMSKSFGHAGQFAMTGMAGAGVANLYKVPKYLYHFTSSAGGAGINATGGVIGGRGLYGSGVYLTRYTSPFVATLQGANSTAAVVRVSTAGLNVSRTFFPGTFIVRNASILLK